MASMARDSVTKHINGSKVHARNVVQDNLQPPAPATVEEQNDAINSIEIAAVQVQLAHSGLSARSAAEQDMWDTYNINGAAFTAGEDPEKLLAKECAILGQEADEFGLWNARSMARQLGFSMGEQDLTLDERDKDDAILCGMIDNAYAEIGVNPDPLQMFLLDTLDNLPRQRVSNSLMRLFLCILSEGGARDVPSLDALRKVQETLHKKGGVPTVPWTSSQGNVFYLNDLRVIIAKDYVNPLTRANLHFYPEIPDGPISEAWHAQKWWRELDRDALTPMIVHGTRHFYVDEIAR
ncbi:hypothetical protein DFH07DRAFT_779832 [Mycena maculata]|uniref:Uncharacterized protein n=1 Tax=Mycena maculata TaxID=230809 RepID=A0AAD7MWH3_9AGAR|nr:hypothetical protein DFH07DRAFT_779832 [Mycena maculata]